MNIVSRRVIAITAVAAVVGLGGVAVAAAATSGTATVRACAAKSGGALRLAGPKGCPKGYRALSWNVTGPRGAAGAKGVPGAKGSTGASGTQGPQGPGISILHFTSASTGTSSSVVIDGWQFTSTCARISGSAVAELQVKAPSGVTFHPYGTEFDSTGQGSAVTGTGLEDGSATPAADIVTSYGTFTPNSLHRTVLSAATLLASTGPSFQVSATLVSDNLSNQPTGTRLCGVDGTITPTGS